MTKETGYKQCFGFIVVFNISGDIIFLLSEKMRFRENFISIFCKVLEVEMCQTMNPSLQRQTC